MVDTTQEVAGSEITETEFLRREAEKAKSDIAASLQRAKAALVNNTDPRELTRRHPWIAIGSAAVMGFAAAAAAIPSKEERELRRLERIRRALTPEPAAAPPEDEKHRDGAKAAVKASLGATLLHELIQLIRPILMTAITASIKAGANPPPVNGQPSAADPGPNNPT